MSRASGIIPAMVTPFKDNHPNEKGIERLVEHISKGGVDGLFILGTAGLWALQSMEERKLVAECTVTTTGKRMYKIVHVGGLVLKDVISLAKHAESVGADAVAVITPFYHHLTEEELINYYREISESVSIPIVLYNIPQFTGYNLKPTTLARLVENVPSIGGIKDSGMSMSQLMEAHYISILNGVDTFILHSVATGLAGSVVALANITPKLLKELERKAREGKMEEAREMQRRVTEALNIIFANNLIPALYAVTNEFGIDVGEPKKPIKPLSREKSREIADRIKKLLALE